MMFNNISGEQIRAARSLCRIDQVELSRLSGLSLETIKRLERIRGAVHANLHTLRAIEEAFHRMGVTFRTTDGTEGVWWVGAAEALQPANTSLRFLDTRHTRPLFRLLYFSKAVPQPSGDMEATLRAIAWESGRRNAALDVTGALLACEGRFLQALEGPKDAVFQIYGRICTDTRHTDLYVAESGPIGTRRFADWRVGSRMVSSSDPMFAGHPSIALGLVRGALSTTEALDLLGVVAAGPVDDSRERRA